MQQQEELFHEDINAALGHAISALGGNKKVGTQLWPSLTPDQAGKKVSNCLNHDHAQQFHPCDILWILRESRKTGIHSAMAFLAQECGYAAPQPIEPEDEAAALMREFNNSVKMQRGILSRLERLNLTSIKAVS